LLILKALALEPMHGWAVSERLQQISREALQVQQGSLYPALLAWSVAAGSRPNGP
jgi:DNA-binding PadR family transcriptional regulator